MNEIRDDLADLVADMDEIIVQLQVVGQMFTSSDQDWQDALTRMRGAQKQLRICLEEIS
jgi:hypothetical protein